MKYDYNILNIDPIGMKDMAKNNHFYRKISKKKTILANNIQSAIENKDNEQTMTQLPTEFNKFGEAKLTEAPTITLTSQKSITPQQFLHYQRTRSNVEHIVSKIAFSDSFPLFVHEENGCVFIQVGIIGHENYPKDKLTKIRPKIVYGRRWYIEPHTPTSEVIQTAYLALIKAREHELREYFHLYVEKNDKTYRTTPFNTHMDLPLMAKNTDYFTATLTDNQNPKEYLFEELSELIKDNLTTLRLGRLSFELTNFKKIDSSTYFLSINLVGTDDDFQTMSKYFPEQISKTHQLIINIENKDLYSNTETAALENVINSIYYQLFQSMLRTCENYVSTHFTFDAFARFDNKLLVKTIAHFSAETRLVANQKKTSDFQQAFKQMVQTVDSQKAPSFATNISLYETQKQAINQYQTMDGYLPNAPV